MSARRAGTVVVLAILAGCVTPPPTFRELGDGVYEINERSERASLRSRELKIRAEERALAYCSEKGGKALSTLDVRLADPDPPAYSSATVQFRCVAS